MTIGFYGGMLIGFLIVVVGMMVADWADRRRCDRVLKLIEQEMNKGEQP